jgi:FtsH-binding integral membrane protein
MLASLKNNVDPAILKTALVGTLGIFGGMFLAGASLLLFGIQLGARFGLGLLYALMMLIVVSIVFMFMGNYSGAVKGLSIFGLFLFSLFVIYDTNMILQRNYYGDFITASLDYSLDIVNIFLNLVNFDNR